MNRRERRVKELKNRRGYLASIVVAGLFWLGLTLMIFFMDPHASGALYIFFVLLFLSIFFTASLILNHSRRGLLIAIVITLFAILKSLGVGSIINFVLLAGVAVAIEYYLLY